MSELLHQNSKGVKIVREDYKKRSQVKVFSEFQGKRSRYLNELIFCEQTMSKL